MAKVRSPNYPVISLGDALEAVLPVFKAENRNKFSRMVLANHLGYSSLNGRALGKIGAVRAYGLIDGSGDDLRLSEDAVVALNAPLTSEHRTAAMGRLALKPTLFSELRQAFPDSHPSIENLRFNLIQRKFTEEAAGKAAMNYLETMCLVSGVSGDYTASDTDKGGPPMHIQHGTSELKNRDIPPPAKPGSERAEFPLAEGVARVEFPSDMSAESYEDLEEWLKLVLRRAKRSVKRADA